MQEDEFSDHPPENSRRVLLMMPMSPLQEVLADYLGQRGFSVKVAPRSHEGLACLRAERWDGVVIDWKMGSAIRWVGEAVQRTNPQARLVVMMPQGAGLRWDVPGLETVVHPFRPSLLAQKLGAWADSSRLGGWFQRVADERHARSL